MRFCIVAQAVLRTKRNQNFPRCTCFGDVCDAGCVSPLSLGPADSKTGGLLSGLSLSIPTVFYTGLKGIFKRQIRISSFSQTNRDSRHGKCDTNLDHSVQAIDATSARCINSKVVRRFLSYESLVTSHMKESQTTSTRTVLMQHITFLWWVVVLVLPLFR